MVAIYLVRHGKASANWTQDLDPGLDSLGAEQANQLSELLEKQIPDRAKLVSSPMQRAQLTAGPLAQRWQTSVTLCDAVSEIPSPELSMVKRGLWLYSVMKGSWCEQSEALQKWRSHLLETLNSFQQTTVVFSHYVAINAVVGALINCEEVTVFNPDYCSVTVIESGLGGLHLVKKGKEADTQII